MNERSDADADAADIAAFDAAMRDADPNLTWDEAVAALEWEPPVHLTAKAVEADGGYSVLVPELPGFHAHAATLNEVADAVRVVAAAMTGREPGDFEVMVVDVVAAKHGALDEVWRVAED